MDYQITIQYKEYRTIVCNKKCYASQSKQFSLQLSQLRVSMLINF